MLPNKLVAKDALFDREVKTALLLACAPLDDDSDDGF